MAEFVESREILEALREIGVDYVQGYALSMPQPFTPAAAAPRKRVAATDAEASPCL
ncbi:Cyclic di-GMP phosphodiesterase YfgF [compost metagenome]